MAHNQEFDEATCEAIYEEEVPSYFSDEESDDMELYNAEVARKEAIKNKRDALSLEREEAYKKRIADQLSKSGEALAGKLNWCTITPASKPASTAVARPRQEAVPEKKTQKVSKRFGKPVPMDIDIKVAGSSFFLTTQPEESVQPVSASVCKYILSETQCPFGSRCKFSHHIQHRDIRQRKLQKFRICRNIENCRFQNDCIYAHSEKELGENVLTCHAGVNCRKIRKHNDEYLNTTADYKCMYIHPNERIRNFIKRTSN